MEFLHIQYVKNDVSGEILVHVCVFIVILFSLISYENPDSLMVKYTRTIVSNFFNRIWVEETKWVILNELEVRQLIILLQIKYKCYRWILNYAGSSNLNNISIQP